MYIKAITLASLSSLLVRGAFTATITVNTPDDLIAISNKANSGTRYYGTTIYLNNDLDFTGKTFNPIAGQNSMSFEGTFDGKGYTISNLVVSSSMNYGGFIGASGGINISNFVMDSSCSFYSTGGSKTIGIVGTVSTNHPTSFKNIVNMADMTYDGPSGTWTLIGGITGYAPLSNYDYVVRNCINYGTITDLSGSTQWSEIGGILGDCHNQKSHKCYIQNSINYGLLKQKDGDVFCVGMGGIVGICHGICQIDNCVNFGSSTNNKGYGYRGGIIGYLDGTYSNFTNNYWSSTAVNSLFGVKQYSYNMITNCSSFNPNTYTLTETIFIGDYVGNSLIDALTEGVKHYAARDYAPWVLNANGKSVSSIVDGKTFFTSTSKLVLLHNFASDGSNMFYGWYTDSGCSSLYTGTSTTTDFKLYGKMQTNSNKYTISFDTRGGSTVASISAAFGTTITLPKPAARSNCNLVWWENVHGDRFMNTYLVTAHDVTLYAVWACTHISTVNDMISFSKAVRWDDDRIYAWKTVYLDADLDFTGYSADYMPIKNTYSFTFDGQGHIISNLDIMAPVQFVGLFWYAYYANIRNLVFADSCTAMSSYQYMDETLIGMVAGLSYGCTIENIVNMGTPFNPRSTTSLYIGGIVGTANAYSDSLRNCVNYGYLLNTGYFNYAYIGGIMGSYESSSANSNIQVYNCANYGLILQKRVSSATKIGGIVGTTYYLKYIDSCIGGGIISAYGGIIGGIIGYSQTPITLSYSKWTADVGASGASGSSSNVVLDNTVLSTLDTSEVAGMNTRSAGKGWSDWIEIHLVKGHLNGTLQDAAASTQRHLPDPMREGCTFLGYYKEAAYVNSYNPRGSDTVTDIYAKWDYNPYTMTYIFDNGTVLKRVLLYDSLLTHPKDTKEGHTLINWCTEDGTLCSPERVPPHDTTFYEVWKPNSYTVKYVYKNGKADNTATFVYGTAVTYPTGLTWTGYNFNGWSPYHATMPAKSFTTTAQWTPKSYKLTFVFGNGNANKVDNVNYGATISYPGEPTKTGYKFTGWDKSDKTMPASDLTFTAQWEIRSYTLTFVFNNGEANTVSTVKYNSAISYPSEPTKTGHAFNGWDKDDKTMPAGDLTITAQWKPRSYTLTFVFNNGEANKVSTVEYGATINYPSNPTKTGFTFNGWDKSDKNMPANHLTITAQWKIRSYKLTFVFNNGDANKESTVEYNSKITYPNNPTKTGFTFNGWDKSDKNMPASDLTITAQWKVNAYKVTYVYDNGVTPNEVREFNYEATVTYPNDPTKTGYSFDGWLPKHTTMPAGDFTTTAQWKIRSYKLTFVFGNGDANKESTVEYNSKITYPSNPTKTGYTFNGWDKSDKNMPASDLTITAKWKINAYKVTYVYDNGVTPNEVREFNYSETITYPNDPTKTGYRFDGWLPKYTTMPAGDFTTTAQWKIRSYKLTFVFGNGDANSVSDVKYGATITYPANPTKTGFTFNGWDKSDTSMPASDLTITAQWDINKYKLTFVFDNGDANKESTVEYNSKITYPNDPTKTGHTFLGWDKSDTNMPADDLTIRAQWKTNSYKLKFIFNNSVTQNEESSVKYGATINYPSNPTKTGYTFNGWDKSDKTMPASDLTITAQWKVNAYKVTYVFDNGVTPNDEKEFNYGATVTYPNDPTKTGYRFDGWSPKHTTMPAGDFTTTAQWKIRSYKLTFVFGNGDANSVSDVKYGATITYPANPTKTGFTFNGWDKSDTSMPAGDLTITAQWKINKYKLTFVFNNGDANKESEVEYGATITYPNDPTKTGFTFNGWDKSDTSMPASDLTITAQWNIRSYKLTFVFGNGDANSVSDVEYGATINYPPNPTRTGSTFKEWDKKDTTMPASDLTITAQWDINGYKLTFVMCDGATVDYGYSYGENVNNPTDTSDGYTFTSWNKTVTTMPAYDDIVGAVCTPNSYTVIFVLDNGEANISKTVKYKETIVYPTGITKTGHNFANWDNDIKVMPANNLTITAKWNVRSYELRFVFNNSVTPDEVNTVEYNSKISYPSNPTKTGYTFNGWDKSDKNMPASDLTITAQWKINKYKVTYVYDNGVTPDGEKEFNYEETVTYPNNPTKTGYSFNEWSPKYTTMPANHFTTTAQWNIRSYKLTFVFDNGDADSVDNVEYGATITYPANPTKTGYTFNGWDKSDTNMPANDLTITAQWKINKYKLTFIFDNGDANKESEVEYDSVINYPTDITKTGYSFNRWSVKPERMPADDLTITAQWNINSYKLRFIFNNSVTADEESTVEYDSVISYPTDPTKTGYTFNGWDKSDKNMPASDLTITAQWKINAYKVTYVYDNGVTPDGEKEFNYEETVTYPNNPTKTGYSFNEWSPKPTTMPANHFTTTAQWKIRSYELRFVFNNSVTPDEVDTVEYNSVISYPTDPTKTGYTFNGWDKKDTNMPANHLTITAQWNINSYELRFVFNNSVTPDEVDTVEYDSVISYPADPTKTGYTFNGWDKKDTNMPANHLTITAQWKINKYNVTFVFNNSITADYTTKFEYDSDVVYPADPTKVGYTFSGWDIDVTKMPANHLTITAQWKINSYDVTFVFNNSITADYVDKFEYDSDVVYPADPTKVGYTFNGWDKVIKKMPANHFTTTAQWKINSYELKFVFDNGVTPDEVRTVEYDSVISYPADPIKTGYTFAHWDKKDTNMPANNLTITAQWNINSYELKFVFNNSVTPDEVRIAEYNADFVRPADPTKVGYTFNGWDIKDTKMPANNLTITAQWNINSYEVTFVYNDSVTPDYVDKFDYDSDVVYPADPTRTGYTFSGWDKVITKMPAEHLTITAQWKINSYDVTFVFNNGEANTTKTVVFNNTIPYPTNVMKEGHSLIEWLPNPERMPAYNFTIEGKWKINNYTLIFDFNNGYGLVEIHTYNDSVTYPKEFVKDGFIFTDWDINITRMPGNDLTITAQWEVNHYKVLFNFVNGTSPLTTYAFYNEPIIYPDDPTREGYKFNGWDINIDLMPSSEMTITAQWIGLSYKLTFVFDNGEPDEESYIPYENLIPYPDDPVREGYEFLWWEPEYTYMPGEDLTVKAEWEIKKYNLTFITYDDVEPQKEEVEFNATVEYPPNPVRTGYTFNGWDINITNMPARDINITAQLTINGYMLTFDFDNGSQALKDVLQYSDVISYPEDPTKEGYDFDKWNDTTKSMPDKNLTIKALWNIKSYGLVFDFDNGDPKLEEVLQYGAEIVYPEEPVKEGHDFDKWDTIILNMPANNLTIKALWNARYYYVTFDFDNESQAEEAFAFGTPVVPPQGMVKEGYTFLKWNETVDSMPAHNLTIRALWDANIYGLTFEFVNGSAPYKTSAAYGSAIEYPTDAQREGHTFSHWDVNVTTMPAYNLTITAQWDVNNYTLTFIFENGSPDRVETVAYNGEIVRPAEPSKEGYTFAGWDYSDDAMPARDLNITALWTAKEYEIVFNFGNGTTTKAVVKCDDVIDYPEEYRNGLALYWSPKPRTMPAGGLTVKAQWIEGSLFVKIVFGTVDLTDAEIEKILKKYTGDVYVIDKVGTDGKAGTLTVIIKFNDSGNARQFVNDANDRKDEWKDDDIVEITLVQDRSASYSVGLYPSFFFALLTYLL